jgi:hypothetical protein
LCCGGVGVLAAFIAALSCGTRNRLVPPFQTLALFRLLEFLFSTLYPPH